MTPYYNKPPQRGLLEHFTRVAEAVDLPTCVYNIPGRTGIRIEHDTLLRLAEVPNIVGVKDSTGDFQAVSRLISEAPPDFEVYSGDDWATFGYLCLGAVGIVSVAAHLVGDRIEQLCDLVLTGRHPGGAEDPRGTDAAVQRAVHHQQPHPREDRPRDGRAPGRPAPAAARPGHGRGARADPQGVGGCRARLTRRHRQPPASSSSAASARSAATWPCVELGGRILLVDVGLSFPHAEMPGVDLVLPDFEYVRERFDDLEAVVLTHGHQDHIGALPYLLRELPSGRTLPVYGTALTLALLEGQLEEHGSPTVPSSAQVAPGEAAAIGPFSMRFIRVTHSIPDGMAVVDRHALRVDPAHRRLQGGPDAARRPAHRPAWHWPRRPAAACTCCCRTRPTRRKRGTRPASGPSGPVLRDIISRAPQIVVVACFASHVHRIQQVVNAARADERVVAFLGRSMHQSVEAARRLGLLHAPEEDVVLIEDVNSLDPSRVVVICTGSQGEPFSALSLMAAREHKWVKLREGDTVVLSSSLIPGNEPAIHRVVDGLYRTGADVFHMPAAPVHASGHAAAEELRLMLSLVRPRWFIPIHGERRHLAHHAKIATEVGIAPDHVLICEDGDVVDVGGDRSRSAAGCRRG